MKDVSTKEMAEFILSNVDILDYFDLRETYTRTIRQRIKKDFGVFIQDSEINYTKTIEENWNSYLAKKILPKFGNVENYKFYQAVYYYGCKIYSLEDDTIQASSLSAHELVYLMLYVVNNELDSDLARAHDICKNVNGSINNHAYFSFTNFNFFGDVQVKKLKNGKITFKGLTEQMRDRLKKVIEVSKIRT